MADSIVMKGVRKTFGAKVAVEGMELRIPQGSLWGFIGPNGAGKTTTIRMIMSIIFPDSGELEVLGRASAVESKDRIGYLPEERGLYRKMKVGVFLKYIGRLKGLDAGPLDRTVHEWLEKVELKDCFKKKCEELSKGMQQKVQFIAAVLHEPDLLILDEPFSGLDPVNRRLLRTLIEDQHKLGRTVIFSTHAMFEAEQLSDHILMINRGKKVLDAPLEEIWRRYDPRSVFVEPLRGTGAEAVEALRGMQGVREAVALPRGVEVRLETGTDVGAAIAAVSARVASRKVELKRPNLEDIFIDLVGGSAEEVRAELGASANGSVVGSAERSDREIAAGA